MKYRWLRSIHLISGALALPLLVMYGVSAVQMAHGKWFDLKPVAVIKHSLHLPAGNDDGRKMAREAMTRADVHGEIETVSTTPGGFNVRVTVPGTVHVIEYDRCERRHECADHRRGSDGHAEPASPRGRAVALVWTAAAMGRSGRAGVGGNGCARRDGYLDVVAPREGTGVGGGAPRRQCGVQRNRPDSDSNGRMVR